MKLFFPGKSPPVAQQVSLSVLLRISTTTHRLKPLLPVNSFELKSLLLVAVSSQEVSRKN